MNKYMGCSLRQLWSQTLFVKPSRKPKRYKCEDHWDSPNHRENKTTKRTNKIPGSMGSQNQREHQQQQQTHKISGPMIRFHYNWSWNRVFWFSRWFWLSIDPGILFCFVCFVFCLMVWATYWSWNLVLFVVWLSRWFWLPIDPGILVFVSFVFVFSMVLLMVFDMPVASATWNVHAESAVSP